MSVSRMCVEIFRPQSSWTETLSSQILEKKIRCQRESIIEILFEKTRNVYLLI
jgi:hypothetical protein